MVPDELLGPGILVQKTAHSSCSVNALNRWSYRRHGAAPVSCLMLNIVPNNQHLSDKPQWQGGDMIHMFHSTTKIDKMQLIQISDNRSSTTCRLTEADRFA